jgi:cyanophycinase
MLRIVALLACLCVQAAEAAPNKQTYFRLGNPADVTTPTTAGTVLMGGSTDVDAAFQWLCARGGNGDFLVIRATGTDAYNPYVQELCPGLNSVATLIIDSIDAANRLFVRDTIAAAEVVWIAGGDQSNYIRFWTDTEVQRQLQARIDAGVPVGGTSAGLAVLTQFVYSALASQGVTSTQALANPFNKRVTLARDFASIDVLQGAIGDTHFVPRDRMGRTLTFLCRIADLGWNTTYPPRAIAVDEQTALLIDETGFGQVVGQSNVYFIEAPGPAEVCEPRTPLTYRNLAVRRVGPGDAAFDLNDWSATPVDYSVSAEEGLLTSTQADNSVY